MPVVRCEIAVFASRGRSDVKNVSSRYKKAGMTPEQEAKAKIHVLNIHEERSIETTPAYLINSL